MLKDSIILLIEQIKKNLVTAWIPEADYQMLMRGELKPVITLGIRFEGFVPVVVTEYGLKETKLGSWAFEPREHVVTLPQIWKAYTTIQTGGWFGIREAVGTLVIDKLFKS